MSDLLTKEDIARELNPEEPLSIRSVERYIELAGVMPTVKGKGRGSLSKYSREDADKIVTAYHAAQAEQQNRSQAVATRKPDALERVAFVGELMNRQDEGFKALSSALDPWPVWISRKDAIELSGVPAAYFNAGVKAGELPHVGRGTGRRYHRDDVRRFADRMREPGYIDGLKK
jgi:hypothetical protein